MQLLSPMRVSFPTTVAEASDELRTHGDDARVYAGGAELVLLMRIGAVHVARLVDVKRLRGMRDVTWSDGRLEIGAAVTHRRLETDREVWRRLPMFADAESRIGNIRIRNQGTLGGNLAFNDPHSDPTPPLLVHDATVVLESTAGIRELALDNFVGETYDTALRQDEILTRILVRALPEEWGQAYRRVERFQRPTLNVAVAARARNGLIAEVRIAAGCLGPRATRLRELEASLAGVPVAEIDRIVDGAKPVLKGSLNPRSDLLGSADYKLHVAGVLLKRGLRAALGLGGAA